MKGYNTFVLVFAIFAVLLFAVFVLPGMMPEGFTVVPQADCEYSPNHINFL